MRRNKEYEETVEIDFAQVELRVFNQYVLSRFERLLSKLHLLGLYWFFRSNAWKWRRVYNYKGLRGT